MRIHLLQVIVFFIISVAPAQAAESLGTGLRRIEFTDPVGHGSIDAVAFYPAAEATGSTHPGPFEVAASKGVSIASGRYPLFLMSHGSLGSLWGNHDLATFLTRHGAIVVSVTHPGDNFRDASRVGSSLAVFGRAMQISAALTAALNDPFLAQHIDPGRIGFVGFSAGGTTGLILAGAKPDFARLAAYCKGRTQDRVVCEARGQIRRERPDIGPVPDDRIRSFALLAPLSVVFSPEALRPVTAPLSVFVGDKDEELSPRDNALDLARDLGDRAELHVIENAGHFTFLAPCTAEFMREMPALCTDRPEIDRVALHRSVNADIARFFDSTLGRPPQ
ncbi:putative dienelactone hydrolase [Rhizobium sp. PP-F2F-G48]|uniref:alpha/beta hydrolase family protein n=1 Tax=Rhizobium sp. PP-F2F-G48 TaxID=2135651 RepID=UPI0010460BC9|nr:dienelactone hydrolase [Rhizobium sp. PP-F2F-G48]TCM58962.1 putative dienelactone hydrolase [Rhizobium sp. PP-F2F-G48]